MPSYWWECASCGAKQDFQDVCESKGITHYIWDALIPSGWEQTNLLKKCKACGQNELRITYIFPRAEETHLQVKHLVGLGPFEKYVPMMWETIPDGAREGTWIDFKYVNGRNIRGLNRPAVLSKEDIGKLFHLYRDRTGDKSFP